MILKKFIKKELNKLILRINKITDITVLEKEKFKEL